MPTVSPTASGAHEAAAHRGGLPAGARAPACHDLLEDDVTTLRDEDIVTTTNTLPAGDADQGDSNEQQVDPTGTDPTGTDPGSGGDADGTDGSDADGSDGSDADGTDS
jgi:hypothetical protein